MLDTTTDLCACGQPTGEAQHQRHLTQAEYDALPESLTPIDGWATTSVKTCGDCALPPFCDHTPRAPSPCPTCQAPPGDTCLKPDGSARLVEHPARAAARPAPETCRHAHREDCDPRACACSQHDPAPVRAPRIAGADAPIPPTPETILDAAAWMAANGIDRTLVRSEFRSGFTQDNRAALLFDYVIASDDGHGHEVVQLRVVPVEAP